MHNIAHWLGLTDANGPWYLFWSGFGGDVAKLTIVIGLFAAWRHHVCNVRWCLRLGQPVPGTHLLACSRHNPAHPSRRRGVSPEDIGAAYEQAKRRRMA